MAEEIAAWPRDNCKCCGTEFMVETGYHRMGLCGPCVQKAANAFWIAHAGEPHRDFDREAYAAYRASIKKPLYVKKTIPEALRWKVFERDGFTCKCCGARDHLRADHIVPERKGGLATLENLQTLCAVCNSRKGDRA